MSNPESYVEYIEIVPRRIDPVTGHIWHPIRIPLYFPRHREFCAWQIEALKSIMKGESS